MVGVVAAWDSGDCGLNKTPLGFEILTGRSRGESVGGSWVSPLFGRSVKPIFKLFAESVRA